MLNLMYLSNGSKFPNFFLFFFKSLQQFFQQLANLKLICRSEMALFHSNFTLTKEQYNLDIFVSPTRKRQERLHAKPLPD